MRITLDYRHSSPSHCEVAVFVNGAFTGLLMLRQEELVAFQSIIVGGLGPGDSFLGTGDPGPEASARMFAHDFPDEAAWVDPETGEQRVTPRPAPHKRPPPMADDDEGTG